jgi:hypothetical protein
VTDTTALDAASLQARMAREKLMGTAHQLQARLDPATLLDEAVETVRTGAADLALTTSATARRRPAVAAGAVVAGLLLLLRRPLWRLVRRPRKQPADRSAVDPTHARKDRP